MKKILEKFKEKFVEIIMYIVITVYAFFVDKKGGYLSSDIKKTTDDYNNHKYFLLIALILIIVAIFVIRKEIKKEEYKNKRDEKTAFIFSAVIYSFFLISFLTYFLNNFLIDFKFLLNKQFEKETITNKYNIDFMKNDFLYIKLINGGYEKIDIDSTKYKNIKLKDSVAVVKSKVGLFKIPYDHEIVEIK